MVFAVRAAKRAYWTWEHDLRNKQWIAYMMAELAMEGLRRRRALLAEQMAQWERLRQEWMLRTAGRTAPGGPRHLVEPVRFDTNDLRTALASARRATS